MKLLSLLICLAMLLTGVAIAEQPAAVSTVVTVRDAVVRLQGEDYPLSPSVVLGVLADGASAVFDFGMPLGEDVLFPVQAKIDENGAAVLLGDSKTAYTFTPEFFTSLMGGEEIPDEAFAMMEAYGDLIRAAGSLESTVTPEMNQLLGEKLLECASVTQTENVEFTADYKTQTGTRYVFEVDAAQMREYLDYAYAQLPADFTEAYFGYMNAMFALTGGPELTSFGELMDYVGMEMSLSGDVTANETSAAGEMIFHVTVDPSAMYGDMTAATEAIIETEIVTEVTVEEVAEAEVTTEEAVEAEPAAEDASVGVIGGADGPTAVFVTGVESEPVSFDIPMEITVHSPDNITCEISTEIEGVQMDIASTVRNGGATASVRYDIPDVGSITVNVGEHPQEDGSVQTRMTMGADFIGGTVALLVEGAALDGESSTSIDFTYTADYFTAGASFTVDVVDAAIEDRISAAEPKLISSLEEAESSTGLMMAAMGLAGDAEPLLNDESIAALVAKVQEILGLNTMAPVPETTVEAVIVEENAELAPYYEPADENAEPDEYYDFSGASAAAASSELSFGWLPEGYLVGENYYDSEYGYYSATLLHADDAAAENPIYVNAFPYDESYTLPSYYSISGGQMQPVDGALAQVYRTEDGDFLMRNAYVNFGSYDADLYAYSDDLTDEDLVNILAGITIVETAE